MVQRTELPARLLLQGVKRCPVPLQPLLGVPRAASAYTLGHALLAAARLVRGRTWPEEVGRRVVRSLLGTLDDMRAPDCPGLAWGYHFPFRSRFAAYAAGVPNVIVTAFVAKGMIEVTRSGLVDCRAQLKDVCDFVLRGLPREATAHGQRFGYLPHYQGSIHNANALAALTLVETGVLIGDAALVAEGLEAGGDVAGHQRPDGSWPYSEEAAGAWVDGFHTGFVLDGLEACHRASRDPRVASALESGAAYYARELFGPNGEPYARPDRRYPLDALAAAQGVETLSWCARREVAAADVQRRLVDWTLRSLVARDGRVAYQVHRRFTDWRQFPRWSLAPMCSALARVAAEGGAQ